MVRNLRGPSGLARRDRGVGGRSRHPLGLSGLVAFVLSGFALLFVVAAPASAAEVYGKIGSFTDAAAFGASGPGSAAVHEASKTLYVVDSSNHRILKFDVSDPANPVQADFPALGANAITQADGTNLDLGPNANIAVDNSGGPQDGTIYLATNTVNNAISKATAFAASGQWLYDFRHDNLNDNNVVRNGGVLMPAAAISVGPNGEIFRLGSTGFLDPTGALYHPGAAPGDLPVFQMVGAPSAGGTVAGSFFWPDASEVIVVSALFGINLNVYGSPTNTLVTDSQFRYAPPMGVSVRAIAGTDRRGHVFARAPQSFFPAQLPPRFVLMDLPGTGFQNTGVVLESFGHADAGTGIGLAYDSAADRLFAPDAGGKKIDVYGRVTVPDAEMLVPGYVDATTATLRAKTDLRGKTVTVCEFEWGTTTSYGNSVACDALPAGSGKIMVSADLTPVAASSVYHSRLVLTTAEGHQSVSADLEWQHPDLPEATTLGTGPQTRAGTAVLGGLVDPNGTSDTRYYIEYSTDSGLADPSFFPPGKDANAGEGTTAERVSQMVTGLELDQTYYFRLVAETGAGRAEGATLSFQTFEKPSAPQPGACANEEFRQGPSSRLPDCRAWERISPADKNGGLTVPGKTVATEDGTRVLFQAKMVLEDSKSYGLTNTYLADRTDEGWSTVTKQEAAALPPNAVSSDWNYRSWTSDLNWLVGYARNIQLPGIETDYNDALYLHDVEQNSTRAVAVGDRKTTAAGIFSASGRDFFTAENSPVLVFKGMNLPVDEGTRYPGSAIYWWSAREGTTLASHDQDGNLVSVPNLGQSKIYATSPDGEKALWAPGPTADLYVARRHASALRVTTADGVSQPGSTNVRIEAWTPDLRFVYFSSTQQFTADAMAGRNLYRYDTESQQLENLAPNVVGGSEPRGIANLTDNGEHIFFYADAQLAPGAAAGGIKLYHWYDDDIELVTNNASLDFNSGMRFTDPSYDRLSRVSSDGRFFLFAHRGSTTGTAMESVVDADGNRVLFRYDSLEGRLDCVSCDPRTHKVTSDAYLTQGAVFMPNLNFDVPPPGERYHMSEDGKVMFTTKQRLASEDADSTFDTYLWDGAIQLLTSGKSQAPEWAETATEDFRDIYVHSYRQLVPADTDNAADLYVARVGGGIASQQTRPQPARPSCEGSGCQGLGAAPPVIGDLDTTNAQIQARADEPEDSRCRVVERRFKRSKARVAKRRAAVRRTARRVRRAGASNSRALNGKAVRRARSKLRRTRKQAKRAVQQRRRAAKVARRTCRNGGA